MLWQRIIAEKSAVKDQGTFAEKDEWRAEDGGEKGEGRGGLGARQAGTSAARFRQDLIQSKPLPELRGLVPAYTTARVTSKPAARRDDARWDSGRP